LKETLVAPVSRLEIMIGRTLGGATIAVIQGIMVFLIALLIGFRPDTWAMLPIALFYMVIIAIIFTALGTAIASVLDDMHGFQLIINFLLMPLFFLSGALFPLTGLPVVLDWIVKFNPLTYGIDAMRGALTGATHIGFMIDTVVLVVVLFVFLGIGSYLFSKMQV
jgi:ABC-2 type transport system permease protein